MRFYYLWCTLAVLLMLSVLIFNLSIFGLSAPNISSCFIVNIFSIQIIGRKIQIFLSSQKINLIGRL